MTEESKPLVEAPKKRGRPANTDALALQIAQALRKDPELAKGVISEAMQSKEFVKGFVEEALNSDDFRKLVGVSGKPKTKRREVTNQDVKNFVAIYGEATHDPDFLPTPPEHIYYKVRPSADNPEGVLNEEAIRQYHENYLNNIAYGSHGAQAVDAAQVAGAEE